MATLEITTILIGLMVFALILALAGVRLRQHSEISIGLMVYLGFGFLAYLSALAGTLRLSPPFAGNADYALLAQTGLLAMMMAYAATILIVVKQRQHIIIAYLAGTVIVLALWLLSGFDLIDAGDRRLISGIGWVSALSAAYGALVAAVRARPSNKHLNRLKFLLIATTLHLVSGVILFISPQIFYWAGTFLLLPGVGLASYIVLSYHTPDLNRLIGATARYFLVTGVIAAIVYLGLAATIIFSRTAGQQAAVLLRTVSVAIILAIVVPLLWKMLTQFAGRIIFGSDRGSTSTIIRQYSRSLSSALDMQRLCDILLDLMVETLNVEKGAVFVNERSATGLVALIPLASKNYDSLHSFEFEPNSLFTEHFRQGHKYLYQYDIDVLPSFDTLSSTERDWLVQLKAEVFVPITRMDTIMGLLAFGKRKKEAAYHPEDIELMVVLADQAVLAMDSARLFQQLATINQEVGSLSEQLAGLDQNKSDFLSIASHELRTPLTHIHGYSRMLLELTEEEIQDIGYVKTIVSGIAKGSERMKEVIDMMFAVTEAHTGDMALRIGAVDLHDLINRASEPFLAALDERRIAFDKRGFELLPTIMADNEKLLQALENLLSNAIKFTPDGGMIAVTGSVIDQEGIGTAVEILVEDTGIGIDPEYHSRIFEKFFRTDDIYHHSTGRTKFKGAGPGLGLTLVKGIAEAHGGQVWVESSGHDETRYPGSKFFFVIPLQPVPTQKKAPQKQSQIETVHGRSKDSSRK